ncbi:MAG: methyltransferase domain-containing protein [Clostridia bacterium]|nr:methyltransferase domain-containing protein [Clostridia bacterium]
MFWGNRMINVLYDCYRILSKVYQGGAFFKQALTDTEIEEKNRAQITKICYGTLDKDIYLEYCISFLCEKRPKTSVRIILKIAMYCIGFLHTAPYAVVDGAVELVKKMGKSGAAGFVNAFLRKFAVTEIILPAEKIKRLSVEYSYPEFAVKKLIGDYGEDVAIKIISAEEEHTCLRFNSGTDGKTYLDDLGANYCETPVKNCFFADGFRRNADYDKGVYTFQSIGSAAICEMVGGGERLLDACAAPGGKSVNLADKFKEVVSCDIHPHRVKLIEEYSKRMGKNNISVALKDASVCDENFFEAFDCVLADVPCSSFGVAKDNPDVKLNREESGVDSLSVLQRKILENLSKYVKKGGVLCYSTCSVFRSENAEICKDFLSRHSDFVEVATECDLPHERDDAGVRFLPHISCGAGFYFCKFKRI